MRVRRGPSVIVSVLNQMKKNLSKAESYFIVDDYFHHGISFRLTNVNPFFFYIEITGI